MSKKKKTVTLMLALSLALSCGAYAVSTYDSVYAEEAPKVEVMPLARWDFSNQNGPEIDATGHGYTLATCDAARNGSWDTPDFDEEKTKTGKGMVVDGAWMCEGTDGLVLPEERDFSEHLNAFTLNFRVKDDSTDTRNCWKGIVSFAYNDGSKNNKVVGFYTKNDLSAAQLEANSAQRGLYMVVSDLVYNVNDKTQWGSSMPIIYSFPNNAEDFTDITLSIQPGGEGFVKVDETVLHLPLKGEGGKQAAHFNRTPEVPAEWSNDTLRNSDYRFSIGCMVGNGQNKAFGGYSGLLDDITVYDFAFSEAETAKYWQNEYKLYRDEIADDKIITEVDNKPVFEGGKVVAEGTTLNDTMTTAEMLATVQKATVKATCRDGKTETEFPVKWERVVKEGDKYYVKGGIRSVFGQGQSGLYGFGRKKETIGLSKAFAADVALLEDVRAELPVTITPPKALAGNKQEVLPVARYDFADAENPGKDSTGHGYDLVTYNTSGTDGTNGEETESGVVENGVWTVDGNDGLVLPQGLDFSEYLNGFTVHFSVKDDPTDNRAIWRGLVTFGYHPLKEGKGNDLFGFFTKNDIAGDGTLRRRLYLQMSEVITNEAGQWAWGSNTPRVYEFENDAQDFTDITISVQPGGAAFVKVGHEIVQLPASGVRETLAQHQEGKTVPADWSEKYLRHPDRSFTIGCSISYGTARNTYVGSFKNVAVYDFAFTEEQTAQYWKNDCKIYDCQIAEDKLVTAIGDTVTFTGGSAVKEGETITDTMTETQMLAALNHATTTATLKNGQSVTVPVVWNGIQKEGNKYYVVGAVNAGLSLANIAPSKEIKAEVPVASAPRDVNVSLSIEHGTVTPDKTTAGIGETVTFTVTPDERYAIETVTVNDVAITPVDGVYSAVMTEDGMSVSATFVEGTPSAPTSESSGKSGCGSVTVPGIALSGILLVSSLFVGLRRKKENR